MNTLLWAYLLVGFILAWPIFFLFNVFSRSLFGRALRRKCRFYRKGWFLKPLFLLGIPTKVPLQKEEKP